MTIHLKCEHCESVLKIKDELAGSSAHCPKCKHPFVVPDNNHSPPNLVDPGSTRTESVTPTSGLTTSAPGELQASQTAHETPQNLNGQTSAEHQMHSASEAPEGADGRKSSDVPDLSEFASETSASSDTVHLTSTATVVDWELADLECPPVMMLTLLPTGESELVAHATHTTTSSPRPCEFKVTETPVTTRPKPIPSNFDPFSFLNNSPPSNTPVPPTKTLPETPTERPSVAKIDDDRPAPATKRDSRGDDIALPGDSDDTFRSPTVHRTHNRVTPAPHTPRPATEKVDLATAARMMKKAIKENHTAEAAQRDADAKQRFDFFMLFREFGFQGLGVLVGGIVLTCAIYFGADRMFGSQLRLPKLGYVRGSITLDGKPLQGATIYFAPLETEMAGSKKERIRTSVGTADERGEFRMMYVPADRIEGVAVGKSRVWITHVGSKGKSVIPLEWSESAQQTRDVTEGHQAAPLDIKLTSKSK
ncbi:hypothetical protein [Schlesneria sp. T3-172]|uniref:hypothetical protein n=1 Tax=Schlesneria sphaerica TaxID=3373610 RepID=UPI0037C9E7EE